MSIGQRPSFGFASSANAALRGSAIVMEEGSPTKINESSVNDITIDSTDDNKESLIEKKEMTQQEKNKLLFKPGYAYFVLLITLLARIMV